MENLLGSKVRVPLAASLPSTSAFASNHSNGTRDVLQIAVITIDHLVACFLNLTLSIHQRKDQFSFIFRFDNSRHQLFAPMPWSEHLAWQGIEKMTQIEEEIVNGHILIATMAEAALKNLTKTRCA